MSTLPRVNDLVRKTRSEEAAGLELTFVGVLIFAVAGWVLAPVAARIQLAWSEMLGAACDLSLPERARRLRGIARMQRAIWLLGALAAFITLLLQR